MRLYDDKQTVNIYSSPGVSLDFISSSRKVMFWVLLHGWSVCMSVCMSVRISTSKVISTRTDSHENFIRGVFRD